jgi:leader peptidase (prepilin peptidase)/N-methyltransferase
MTDLQIDSPTLFALSMGLLGLIVGSFLNVVIHRLPKMMEQDWRAQCAELLGQKCGAPEAERYTLAEDALPAMRRSRYATPLWN